MAVRPVYIPKNSAPFYDIVNIEFKWNGGFAVSQKQKATPHNCQTSKNMI